MSKNSWSVRSVSAVAIIGLSLGLGAPAAVAQTDPAAPSSTATSLIDPAHAASLTVHKKKDPVKLGTQTGLEDPSVSGADLEGAGFTIYKINGIDLTTNEGLAAAAGIQAADYMKAGAADETKVTKVGEQKLTAADGTITWDLTNNLGAYLVVETGPVAGYQPAAPFIAFVPMTSGNATDNPDTPDVNEALGGSTWNYDVYAYPKNYSEGKTDKKVVDKDQNSGDKQLVYTVSGTANAIDPEKKRTQFTITDKIDPKLTITSVTATGENLKDDASLEPGDYVATFDADTGDAKVTLTQTGLDKLVAGSKINAIITTTVDPTTTDPTSVVPNTGQVYQNNPDGSQMDENQPGNPTPTVKTFWGGVKFKKVNSKGDALEGAEFQIFRIAAGKTCDSIDPKDKNTWPTPVNGTQAGAVDTTFESATDGTVLVTGLHVNDFENNDVVPENSQSKYCLVETKSPKGYELLAKAEEFKLVAASSSGDLGTANYDRVYNLASVQVGDSAGEVVNLEDTTPQLPLTGGAGIGVLAAIGAALVAAGAWFARRNSKKA